MRVGERGERAGHKGGAAGFSNTNLLLVVIWAAAFLLRLLVPIQRVSLRVCMRRRCACQLSACLLSLSHTGIGTSSYYTNSCYSSSFCPT